jgi:acetyltransferase-like isoleucine patch superfamily enzyme
MTEGMGARVDPNAYISPTAVIGSPFRPLLDGRRIKAGCTIIKSGVWVGQFVTVGEGVTIGAGSLIEDYVIVHARAVIGERVVISGRSWIGIDVTVGDDSVIKGHIDDFALIGRGCRVMGDLIHRQLEPSLNWDAPASEEPSPKVEDGAFIGWRSLVIGGVKIGAGAYVCAGALVTKDVPAGHIASGKNQIIHHSKWPGQLAKSPFFAEEHHLVP